MRSSEMETRLFNCQEKNHKVFRSLNDHKKTIQIKNR
jgi:hypothetical protein